MRVRDFFFEVIFWTPRATYGGPSAIYVYEYAVRYLVIHCRSLAPDGLRTERFPPQPGTSEYRFIASDYILPRVQASNGAFYILYTRQRLTYILQVLNGTEKGSKDWPSISTKRGKASMGHIHSQVHLKRTSY